MRLHVRGKGLILNRVENIYGQSRNFLSANGKGLKYPVRQKQVYTVIEIRVENMVTKAENAQCRQFLHLPQ